MFGNSSDGKSAFINSLSKEKLKNKSGTGTKNIKLILRETNEEIMMIDTPGLD